MSGKQVAGYECRHISYAVSKNKDSDACFVKEYKHFTDGTKEARLKMIKDFKRPFWVTKPSKRNHKDKMQWELKSNLIQYECRQIDLLAKADIALGGYGNVSDKRTLFKSPYLYGCAIKPQCLIKNVYDSKFANLKSKLASVAVIDTETDVLNGTGEIIVACISFKERVHLAIVKSFFNDLTPKQASDKIIKKADELIGDHLRKRNINLKITYHENSGALTKALLGSAHEWMPDFVTFWNMDFDVPKMVECLEKHGFDVADAFSDPSVPNEYKFFTYREGASVKRLHDGRTTSINPEQRWHVAECPATFFLIDAMTLYYRVRLGSGMEESYSLDSVLERNLDINKLTIEATEHLTGIDYHKEMQSNYKVEYCVYNIFDCLSTEMLDESTGDVSIKLPSQCRFSDYTDFKSGPVKLADSMHFHLLKNDRVVGVIGDDARDENDKYVLDPDDWIVTLGAYMGHNLGIDFVEID